MLENANLAQILGFQLKLTFLTTFVNLPDNSEAELFKAYTLELQLKAPRPLSRAYMLSWLGLAGLF